jgi:hypothetical protein
MRALTEVVAAVRHTVEKLGPLIHESSVRGIVTGEQAHQLNYHCDLLLHGGRFDWEHYFENGAWAVLERKGRQRSKEERQKFEERAHYLKIEKCIESWSKKQPLARFTYDYLCDLVHPNKGSNLVLLVKREQSVLFDVDGSVEIGHLIFDRIFPLVVKLCVDETRNGSRPSRIPEISVCRWHLIETGLFDRRSACVTSIDATADPE